MRLTILPTSNRENVMVTAEKLHRSGHKRGFYPGEGNLSGNVSVTEVVQKMPWGAKSPEWRMP